MKKNFFDIKDNIMYRRTWSIDELSIYFLQNWLNE